MGKLHEIWQRYHYAVSDLADPRTKDWWLVERGTPGKLLMILASYLFFCIYVGPSFMKDRKPYKLKNIIAVYNFFQVLFSIFLVIKDFNFVFADGFNFINFKCHNIDYSEVGVRWAELVWWYYMAKISELLDTVFFVLRKKNNQVSFLHLYHHTSMPLFAWWATKYVPGGQCIPEGGINSLIHVFMYTYYFVSGLGPRYQKYLWWKKYLTLMQLVQFCIVIYLNVSGLLVQNCNYPKYFNIAVLLNCAFFFYMFGKFYIKSYTRKSKVNQKNN